MYHIYLFSNIDSRRRYDRWLREQRLHIDTVLIGESVTLSRLDSKLTHSSSYYDCHCGGTYELSRVDIDRLVDQIVIPCSNCSLFLRVSIDDDKQE